MLEPFLRKALQEYKVITNNALVEQGEIPKYAFFLVSGNAYLYYLDEEGENRVFRFYRENTLIARLCFIQQTKSLCYIRASKDAMLLRISNTDMEYIYETMAGMREFAMLTVMQYDNHKEQLRDVMLSKEPKDRVPYFYEIFPKLRDAKTVRLDKEIASYLNISVRTLRKFRNKNHVLFESR